MAIFAHINYLAHRFVCFEILVDLKKLFLNKFFIDIGGFI